MLLILIEAAYDTMQIVLIATVFAVVIGLPIGLLLEATHNNHILRNKYLWIHKLLNTGISFFTAVPGFLLLVMLMLVFNSILADHFNIEISAIISLTLIGIIMFAKDVFLALNSLPKELSDTAKFLGAKPIQVLTKFLVPDAAQTIVTKTACLINNLISLTIISSTLGVKGLGKVALEQGYNGLEPSYIFYSIVFIGIIVYLIEYCGKYIANKLVHSQAKID